jgi:integrase
MTAMDNFILAQDCHKATFMLTTFDHPITGKTYRVFDGGVPGFAVKITKAGFKTAVFVYSTGGHQREMRIGSPPVWTIHRARKEAQRLRGLVDIGEDPQGDRVADRTAPDVRALIDRYVEDHLGKLRPSSIREYSSLLTIIKDKIGSKKVAAVEFQDIEKMHRDMSRTAGHRANRLIAVLSRLFNLAIKWGWLERNPCKGIEKNHEEGRERFLTESELSALLSALDDHQDTQAANIIRLLILTGARKSEVLSAAWDMFDLPGAAWTKPSSHTKQNKVHRVTLSVEAVELLGGIAVAALHERTNLYVFPGIGKAGHRADIKKNWRAILKAANLDGVRIHDLRHSAASFALNAGESLSTIGRMLGHSQSSTTQRYAHVADQAQRRAANSIGSVYRGARGGARQGADSAVEISFIHKDESNGCCP